MRTNYKSLSILSIITFIGILLLQAFWIMDSFTERQEHFKDHINNVLDDVSKNFCELYYNKLNLGYNEHDLMDSLLNVKLLKEKESPHFQFEITNANIDPSVQIKEQKYFYFSEVINCPNQQRRILHLYVLNKKTYFLGKILGWLILSSLFIIVGIFALYYNLSFLRKQKKVDRIKSDFISNMTHELKTPIATISVASEMLLKDRVLDDRNKSKRYTTIIHEENRRLKKLVDRVMQIALFENGTMRIKLKELDVHKTIEQSSSAMQMIIDKRKGTITLHLDATHFILKLDATHFSNIITNLIENAIKYSDSAPEITIKTIDYSEGILISIADKGIGIPKKYHEKVFDRFFRVESGDIHNTQGFGLGLYYVRRVVESHGGIIKLFSTEKEGSRFELYFPIA